MPRIEMVQSYVRDLMEELSGGRPELDESGAMSIQVGSTEVCVRVLSPEDPVVRIHAVAATEVADSIELYRELNEMNGRLRFARVSLREGRVILQAEIWGLDVDPSNFGFACRQVGDVTQTLADKMVKEFGGNPSQSNPEPEGQSGGPDTTPEKGQGVTASGKGPTIGDPTPSEFKGEAFKPGDDLPGMYL